MACSLSVFESKVLSVVLKHKRELIRGESSKSYDDNCRNFYSSRRLVDRMERECSKRGRIEKCYII